MSRLVLIDGNSILNRAFYGIMGNKMLTTADGKYTNAVYGFLAILFKVIDDLNPEYMAVAFDLKAPTERHKLYEGYKATRKGMPNELAEQMPIVKEILKLMNITIIEKEGYEADDILGTLAKRGEKEGLEVTIVSGDRDTFQLTSKKISVRIPHTKVGKTEIDTFGEKEIEEKYGVSPKELIDVKGLMGDTSDNIPGVPGIGEKTALELIKTYKSIDKIYNEIENNTDTLKEKLKQKLIDNKDLAILSRTLGTININAPIDNKIEDLKVKEWDNAKVFEKFILVKEAQGKSFKTVLSYRNNLHVFFILSDNYYQSVASMNEMGAAWILQTKYTTVLLPNFEFKEIQGAINPRKIGLKLDSEETEVKEKLGQLKDTLVQEFCLSDLPSVRWERKRDAFISSIAKLKDKSIKISDEALKLLQAASDAKDGVILKTSDFSGTYITANNINFITSQDRREVAKWESGLLELINLCFIEARGDLYMITKSGYEFIDTLDK